MTRYEGLIKQVVLIPLLRTMGPVMKKLFIA
jgi:hypothetical protein